jgi:gamma-tubulin complex component 5
MGETREAVMEAGKARGLLKGLLEEDESKHGWKTLHQLVVDAREGQSGASVDLDTLVQDHLGPICQITNFRLRRVLEEECGLEQHLDAIEGITYFAGHDAIDRWTSALLDQVCRQCSLPTWSTLELTSQINGGRRWNDMQSLTTSFRDAIEDSKSDWLNSSALRIVSTQPRSSASSHDPQSLVVALGKLRASYSAPFPLSVLFTSTSLGLRSEVFGFLVQLSLARRAAHQRLVGAADGRHLGDWAELYRLLWLLECVRSLRSVMSLTSSTIWTWITQRVIEVQGIGYRARLAMTSSLQEMISLELDQ